MSRQGKQRTTFGVRFYPAPIEREAERCIETCLQDLGLQKVPLPIPVDQWIEGPLKIDFGIEDLSPLGKDVLGAAFIRERRIVIDSRVARWEERFRFTCAHELGHMVLHGKLGLAFRDTTSEPGQKDLHEREADRFAAAFLMPLDAVVSELLELCRQRSVDPMTMRAVVLSGSDESASLVTGLLAPTLSRRFRVSNSAAIFRLREVLTPEVGAYTSAVRPPWGL